jgi:hypothetical protein
MMPFDPQPARTLAGLDWSGCEVAILASGETLSVEQCEAVRKWRDAAPAQRKAIAINTTFRRALWADVLYACDLAWWQGRDKTTDPTYYEEARAKFAGHLWTQDEQAATLLKLNHIRSQRQPGLSRLPGVINQGDNSGYQAVGLAHQAGAATAYLLGFDMRGGHWHGRHPGMLDKNNRFDLFIKSFERMAADLVMTPGFTVINCTPGSSMRCFPMLEWQEVFA